MRISPKANTIIMSFEELAALPRETSEPSDGYFRGASVADGHPMVAKWIDDPLDGWRRRWYHVEIQPPRAFNSCKECGREFPGPRGATDYIDHICTPASRIDGATDAAGMHTGSAQF